MSRLLSRRGPWLFVVAIAYYIAGNGMLEHMRRDDLAVARAQHHDAQFFDIGGAKNVSLEPSRDEVQVGQISVVFDPKITQAIIENANLNQVVTGAVVDGTFIVSFGDKKDRGNNFIQGVAIHLPTSIQAVTISRINATEISGNFPDQNAELLFKENDCNSNVTLADIAIDKLTLTASCNAIKGEHCCARGYEVGQNVRLNTLNVSMQEGSFKFASDVIPHKILLEVGDRTEVTAGRSFLQAAEFGK